MKFLLLNYLDYEAMQKLPKEEGGRLYAAYQAYVEAMKKDGVFVDNHGLKGANEAKTVRAPNGKTTVQNGPFAETKEQLGGYFLIDVPDMDAALKWAERNPNARYGAVEVRPIWG
jgi:hypothetical protein